MEQYKFEKIEKILNAGNNFKDTKQQISINEIRYS